ncbi:hypothetical protein [Serratia fonticola]
MAGYHGIADWRIVDVTSPTTRSCLLALAIFARGITGCLGRCVALSPTEEVVFCGALGAAWMGMLALGFYWLFFP